MAQYEMDQYGGESDANAPLAILPVHNISLRCGRHIVFAQNELGKPKLLTRGYIGIDAVNRPLAQKGAVNYDPDNYWLDEYPFASTVEGGVGASVMMVDKREQRIQGGQISSMYNWVNPGDRFFVLPISSKEYSYIMGPAYYTVPDRFPMGWVEKKFQPVPLPALIDVLPTLAGIIQAVVQRVIKVPTLYIPPSMFPKSEIHGRRSLLDLGKL